MFGGPGNDGVKGAAGNDVIIGEQAVTIDVAVALPDGGTVVFATPATGDNDKLNGDRNDDTIEGGPGSDIVEGGAGADHLDGGAGADQIYRDGGTDVCSDADAVASMAQCE